MKTRAQNVAEKAADWARREGVGASDRHDWHEPHFGVNGAANAETANALAAVLEPRRFDISKPPAEAVPIYKLGEAIIATAGNIVGIQAQAKAGKTALIGAKLAAAMGGQGDCLGIVSANPRGLALVHIDTEQSPADHHKGIVCALYRAGLSSPPPWLRSYRLADVRLLTRRAVLAFEIERAALELGGIHSVIIDGIGDLCADPNDPAEAFALVDHLHQLAIRFDTVILAVLHENPGSERGKTRGHLGSQLERKAETNLRLSKDGEGITVVFADKARHAHIPREHGQRFKWCDETKMHVSTETAKESRRSGKLALAEQMAKEAFRDTPAAMGMSWSQLVTAVEKLEEVSNATARRRVAEWTAAKVIRLAGERYFLA